HEGQSTVGKNTIHILVDCGSTHNFVDISAAKKLGCHIRSTCPLAVTVGDGYNIATTTVRWYWVQPELQTVVEEFKDVFVVPKELPPSRPCDHRIPLLKDANSVNVRPYKHPPTQKDAIESMVQELLDSVVIRSSTSPFDSPIVMVKKKDNTWRCF
ncbi:reverse transcriptase, partial [Tanacetum coccineum]